MTCSKHTRAYDAGVDLAIDARASKRRDVPPQSSSATPDSASPPSHRRPCFLLVPASVSVQVPVQVQGSVQVPALGSALVSVRVSVLVSASV